MNEKDLRKKGKEGTWRLQVSYKVKLCISGSAEQ